MRQRISQLEQELKSLRGESKNKVTEIDALRHLLEINDKENELENERFKYKLLEIQSQNTILAKEKEFANQATLIAKEKEHESKLAQNELKYEKAKISSLKGSIFNIQFDFASSSHWSFLLIGIAFGFLLCQYKEPILNFITSFITVNLATLLNHFKGTNEPAFVAKTKNDEL